MADLQRPEPAAEPEARGSLDIAERVVRRVAEYAALDHPGVARRSAGLDRVTGRELPRVSASVAGSRVRLGLDVAVAWPSPAAETAVAVRDGVRERVETLTGLTVDAVDVSIVEMVDPVVASGRRVR